MSRDQVIAFIEREFPQIHESGRVMVIEEVRPFGARVRMVFSESSIRPGGTISGPAMFTLADFAMYVGVLGAVGPEALAVTTSFNINFLSRPAARDLIADVRILKLGRRLVVADIELYSDGETGMVAHATGTYSIPPNNGERTAVK